MTFQDIRFALKATGVDDDFSELLIQFCRENGTNYHQLDEMLEYEGYQKVFTDEFFGWADIDDEYENDEFFYVEKNHHKPQWNE